MKVDCGSDINQKVFYTVIPREGVESATAPLATTITYPSVIPREGVERMVIYRAPV